MGSSRVLIFLTHVVSNLGVLLRGLHARPEACELGKHIAFLFSIYVTWLHAALRSNRSCLVYDCAVWCEDGLASNALQCFVEDM